MYRKLGFARATKTPDKSAQTRKLVLKVKKDAYIYSGS
jgi:hypothetical protein